jgi:hypothetical protein
MKAVLLYQEIKKASNSDSLTCTAKYLTDVPMSDCSYDGIRKAFVFQNTTIETVFVDGRTGCWGVEIKVTNQTEPLPLIIN